MTCVFGDGVVLCDGRSGGWRVGQARCPWCQVSGDGEKPRRVLYIWIYGGYGGRDLLCGECGYRWSDEQEQFKDISEDERNKNKGLVAGTPDPKCEKCHDTGDTGMPGLDMPDSNPCDCGAKP